MIDIPAKQVPPIKYSMVKNKNIIITTQGGLGDQVCSEPAIRYAFNIFNGYEISLITSFPELFFHLPFKNIWHKSDPELLNIAENEDNWLVLHCYAPTNSLTSNFIEHAFIQPVEYACLSAYQRQIPIINRQIKLSRSWDESRGEKRKIVIHPGKGWESKTFPVEWWQSVADHLGRIYPNDLVIIGNNINQNQGTVDIKAPKYSLDLRNKLTLNELASILHDADLVITNDSAPLHMATTGDACILFIASCKHPDYLKHWRKGIFGWRMFNLEKTGLWDYNNECPIREKPYLIDQMDEEIMKQVLPPVYEVIDTAVYCIKDIMGKRK